jgi:hypothetical protein
MRGALGNLKLHDIPVLLDTTTHDENDMRVTSAGDALAFALKRTKIE